MKSREKLSVLYENNTRELIVTARIKEFGAYLNQKGNFVPTAMIVNIRNAETNELLCDHTWILVTNNISGTLAVGKIIKFKAIVQKYRGDRYGIGCLQGVK